MGATADKKKRRKRRGGKKRRRDGIPLHHSLMVAMVALALLYGNIMYTNIRHVHQETPSKNQTTKSRQLFFQDEPSRTAKRRRDDNNTQLDATSRLVPPPSPPPPVGDDATNPRRNTKKKIPDYHIVFSTSCSEKQHWQSYILWFHLARQQQRVTTATRIVSGCKDAKTQAWLRGWHAHHVQQAMNRSHYVLHFTPDFTKTTTSTTSYNFFNKPLGLRHWLEEGLGYRLFEHNNPRLDDAIFIVLDPDQIVMRPLVHDYTNEPETWHVTQQFQAAAAQHDYYYSLKKGWRVVGRNQPIAQRYMFGAQWLDSLSVGNWTLDLRSNVTKLIQEHQHAASQQQQQGKKRKVNITALLPTKLEVRCCYLAGPPYLLTGFDFLRIIHLWATLVSTVYLQTNRAHLAEMYAYSLAAALLQIPHQLVDSMMVSHPGVSQEGWRLMEQQQRDDDEIPAIYSKETVAAYKKKKGLKTGQGLVEHSLSSSSSSLRLALKDPQRILPHVLHYCQAYHLGPFYFTKYALPLSQVMHNCSYPLLMEPATSSSPRTNDDSVLIQQLADAYNWSAVPGKYLHAQFSEIATSGDLINMTDLTERRRSAWLLVHLLRQINQAALFYRQRNCNDNDHQHQPKYTLVWPHMQGRIDQLLLLNKTTTSR